MTSLLELGVLSLDSAATTSGSFFEALTASEFYKNTKVIHLATYVIGSFALFGD